MLTEHFRADRFRATRNAHLAAEILIYLLIAAVFFFTRYAQLFYFEIPIYRPDWSGYFKVLQSIFSGEWPDLTTRPPGYPLFVALIYKVTGSHMAVLYAQNLLRLLSLCLVVFAAFRLDRRFGYAVAFAVVGVAGRQFAVSIDARILSDTLYASLLTGILGFFLLGVATRRARYFALASVCTGYLILTKPAGHWALVTLALIFFYVVFTRTLDVRRSLVALAVPAIVLVGGLTVYNGLSAGMWRTSAYGGANIAGATWFYWDQSDAYPSIVNNLIANISENSTRCGEFKGRCIKPKHVRWLRDSWDLDKLSKAYANLYGFWSRAWKFGLKSFVREHYGRSGHGNLKEIEPLLYRLAFDSILSNPRVYVATVIASMYRLDYGFIDGRFEFNPNHARAQIERARRFYKRGWYQENPHLALGKMSEGIPAKITERVERAKAGYRPWVVNVSKWYHEHIQDNVFNYPIIGVFYLGVVLLSAGTLIASRLRHDGAWIAFVVSTASLGASLIVALVEIGNVKYAEPSMVLRYVSIVCVLLLLPSARRLGCGRVTQVQSLGQ